MSSIQDRAVKIKGRGKCTARGGVRVHVTPSAMAGSQWLAVDMGTTVFWLGKRAGRERRSPRTRSWVTRAGVGANGGVMLKRRGKLAGAVAELGNGAEPTEIGGAQSHAGNGSKFLLRQRGLEHKTKGNGVGARDTV